MLLDIGEGTANSDNDGIFDIVAAGSVDINSDGAVDEFIDLDGNGFQSPNENTPAAALTGTVKTGLKASGCALTSVPTAFDPMLHCYCYCSREVTWQYQG